MNKVIVILLLIVFTGRVSAQNCEDIGLRPAYPPIKMGGVTACFLYVKTNKLEKNQLSIDPDGLILYSISESQKPKLIYEFPYAGTKGEIQDAFIASVDGGPDRRLFVIHRIETPSSWESTSDIYDVIAIKFEKNILTLDKQISRFFDMGGDLIDSSGNVIYRYPYKNKASIKTALNSSLFNAANSASRLEGVIRENTFLYEGDHAPAIQDRSKIYLTKGDLVVLKDSVAGWCKVSHAAKVKTVEMWAQCQAIAFQR
jgi:hypothetical protein